ncbi:MAG TPA: isoprenylcysteine carboxylmethyltransferase family protein [Bacteroidota bacterium]|nr:isoprenylcysteine carboxylmethyltransferase family protein [Bacteroidota bacterium]
MNKITPSSVSTYIVMLSWFLFAGAFFLRRRYPSGPSVKSDRKARFGVLLQAAGIAATWIMRRNPQHWFISETIDVPLHLLAAVISLLSVWLVMAAINALGKFWSLSARLVEDHRLITTGPYSLVRHPIYSGLFGLMIATGICVSSTAGLIVACGIYLVGFSIRAGREEALLLSQFGASYEEYRESTPALIPFPTSLRRR